MRYKKHWIALAVITVVSFAILGREGVKLHRELPPIPGHVVDETGTPLFDGPAITRGQNVWQSLGGQQVGSIWGHGAYVAPDWTADWLHRESTFILDEWSRAAGATSYQALSKEAQAALQARLADVIRTNRYDKASDTLVLPAARVHAFDALAHHYADVFAAGRPEYAIPRNALVDAAKMTDMARFFWWTSWVASTERPGSSVTYTSNWPHEPLIGNRPTSGAVLWSVLSVVLLLAGIAGLVLYHTRHRDEQALAPPPTDPFLSAGVTASQRATFKYFFVVALLIVAQVALGGVTAHFGVEGNGFFGIPLAEWLPYAVTRSWHTQLGIFWIATAWLGTGLFLAPAIGGREPRFQRLGVNVLFVCLLVIVVGALAGQWLSVQQRLNGSVWYWFGHQGYEYVDLGRFWQIFLFAGLFIWLGLMLRALWPALRRRDENRPLLVLFTLSSAAIALFYGAGLMYGKSSHLASVEYWRWWVIHLWVEGFFEVFATVAIAFLFVRLGVLRARAATPAVLFATAVFLAGGIVGTLHHLYFTGTPSSALALGAVFSALEIVPLTLIGFEVWQNLQITRQTEWLARYKWPVYFFVAVAFWNLVGAGLFGFLINPPISLYYVQGLNLTPVHGHTALFGVYGMLGIGLLLFSLRALSPAPVWRERPLAIAFWSLNIGLLVMVVLSMLPIGLLQAQAAVEHGLWYARSAEFMQKPLVVVLKWLRMPGDTIFATGAVALAWFVVGLWGGWSVAAPAKSRRQTIDVPGGQTAQP
ncbi:MAG TPA: nitric-oxide reductase large subunit [Polyangia bacterium]|nr:nitric-oxide reductase large subunit [Polyangia bacterium]